MLLLAAFAPASHALGTGELVDVVIQAVEPQLAPAKPLVVCLIGGKSMEQCVQVELQKQAGGLQQQAAGQLPFNPNDNRIQQIIVIAKAASAGQWLEVLNKGGPTVAKIVGCAALPPGVKSVGCPIVEYVVDHNKNLLDKAHAAVQGPDWWALVELLGPQTACSFIPIPEIKSTLCGPFGEALAALAGFAEGGVNAIGNFLGDLAGAVVSFTEDLAGQSPPMPADKFYAEHWLPHVHRYVMSALWEPSGMKGVEADSWVFGNCVSYFDSHKASEATAKKVCSRMQSHAMALVNSSATAVKAAVPAYLAATLRPQLPRLRILHFEPQPGEAVKLGEKNWPYLKPYDQLYSQCVMDLRKRIGVMGWLPNQYPYGKWTTQPDNAWKWACDQAMLAIVKELNGWRQQGAQQLLAKMSGVGCQRRIPNDNQFQNTKTFNAKLYLVCATYDGYDTCRREITAHGVPGHEQCEIGQQAGVKLAAQVAAELGTKRCALTPNYANIRCTRPWKFEQCLARALPPEDAPAWHGQRINCELKEDPQFTAGLQQVRQILFQVNGGVGSKTDAIGSKQGQAGAWKPATGQNCWATQDPLAIRCKSEETLAAQGLSLPACALHDPNRDGADEPCVQQIVRARSAIELAQGGQPVQVPIQLPAADRPPAGGRLSSGALAGLVGQIRATVLRIEAEGLFRDGAFQLRGGQITAQPMSGFGPDWGGNAQLFWHGGGVGAVLDLMIDVPQDGAWVVEIDLTRAPDYGQLAFEVDQHRVAASFDGYAPGVVGPVTVTLGTFAMRQGRRPVSLMITGRNPASTGFLAGVDRILLKPSGG
ncbi:MAG: hypothetical protein FJ191_04965 [Gammaproteobacteria bacterium]|nr:hypothetical protein [Gammaproteobacteria bacterium]